MFFGRMKELETLESLYKKRGFEMLVLYGRRRIGKTTLISQFIQGKPAIFFSAQEANDKMNLEMFSRLLYQFFGLESAGLPAFENWNSAFLFLAEKTRGKRMILVIDEFPYAVGANKGLKSTLQNIIDHHFKKLDLFIILSGSQIGFMENEVMGYKSPLFGRRTAQMKLGSFDYIDAAAMLSKFNSEDKIKLYCCVGGTPYYLARIDSQLSVEKNLETLFFEPSGYLYEEPLMLLKQELREGSVYHSIISAIALGATRLNEISLRIGEERTKTIRYLDTLIGLNILYKEFPFGENPEKSRKGFYRIRDNCYRFWYRYVFTNKTVIEQGAGAMLFRSFLPELNSYIGGPFEDICMQYMIRRNNLSALPFVFTRSGRWWGANPKTRQQEEIDMVFSDTNQKRFIFAECKWRNDLKDTAALESLIEKSKLYNHDYTNHDYTISQRDVFFCLFSKTSFSKSCVSLAQRTGNVALIGQKELFSLK
ncbi:MAG: ATP-binding protein [Treponema sp.]|jgi:AAA+ ATPase superfamily predicted ATPase|nr:ATP-binding protein [Treponema sp.]